MNKVCERRNPIVVSVLGVLVSPKSINLPLRTVRRARSRSLKRTHSTPSKVKNSYTKRIHLCLRKGRKARVLHEISQKQKPRRVRTADGIHNSIRTSFLLHHSSQKFNHEVRRALESKRLPGVWIRLLSELHRPR
jgi:hypothetical protein